MTWFSWNSSALDAIRQFFFGLGEAVIQSTALFGACVPGAAPKPPDARRDSRGAQPHPATFNRRRARGVGAEDWCVRTVKDAAYQLFRVNLRVNHIHIILSILTDLPAKQNFRVALLFLE